MLEDLYRALGLTTSASLSEVKKAYRLLAKEYHPDKNKDGAEKFKEINHAYSILTDPEKRKEYVSKQSTEMPYSYSFGMKDPFSYSPFEFPFFTTTESPPPPPSNPPKSSYTIKTTCSLSLEEIFNGSRATFVYKEDIHCQTCKGNPHFSKQYRTCTTCGGSGITHTASNSRRVPLDSRCRQCLGKGSIKYYNVCKACDGKKTVNRTVVMRVPKGVHSGHALQLKNRGNLMPDGKTRGGLIFRVQEKPHSIFSRRGDHLFMDVHISLKEALLGFKNKVICTHLDGRTMTATQTAGETIKPGSRKVIQGEGMPIFGSQTNKRGDLYITFHVDFPDTIQIPKTREARMAIDDLFETEQEREAKENAIVIDDDESTSKGQSRNDAISIDDSDALDQSIKSKKRKLDDMKADEEDDDEEEEEEQQQAENILQNAPEVEQDNEADDDEDMEQTRHLFEEEDGREPIFNPINDFFKMFF